MSAYPDSKVHGANMGPIWGQQDSGGPHVGPMNFAIWVVSQITTISAVRPAVYSGAHQRKHKRYWPLLGESSVTCRYPSKGSVTRKIFLFFGVIMIPCVSHVFAAASYDDFKQDLTRATGQCRYGIHRYRHQSTNYTVEALIWWLAEHNVPYLFNSFKIFSSS